MNVEKICRHCGATFVLLPGKPGYADECPACLEDRRPKIQAVDPPRRAAKKKVRVRPWSDAAFRRHVSRLISLMREIDRRGVK